MAFIKDYSQAPIGVAAARDSIKERCNGLIQLSCALSSGRIVITMMATSKHLIKQQDEVFIGVCRRLPYMPQGNP
jgi:hypothetical protein